MIWRLAVLSLLLCAIGAGCRSNNRPGGAYSGPRLQNPEATPASQLYSS